MRDVFVIWLTLSVLVASPARAQDPADAPATRAEVLQREREGRATTLRPHEPNVLERSMTLAEDRLLPLLVRDGVHWKIGSLTTGSGLAYGGGFRHRRLFDRQGAFNIWAAASLKRYWALEARFDLPNLADGRLVAGAYARRHSYPREDFFGVGPDASRRNHVNFAMGNSLVGAHAGVKPVQALTVGAGYEYARPRLDRGGNDDLPTITRRFDDDSAPGLMGDHNFHRTRVFAEFDYRRPVNARKGGWYRLDLSHYREPTGAFAFRRADVDLRQYASVLAERRVFAFRLFASTSTADDDARVPFYLMPTLGGHDTLRGFRDYRFRGPHALLTQSEYRWEVWSGLDAALFYDAGKVAHRRADLNLRDLEDAYGFGFRFHTANGVLLRVDAGFGSRDGRHLYIVFGDVF
jgi:outer membrane protein assembly factor BamA